MISLTAKKRPGLHESSRLHEHRSLLFDKYRGNPPSVTSASKKDEIGGEGDQELGVGVLLRSHFGEPESFECPCIFVVFLALVSPWWHEEQVFGLTGSLWIELPATPTVKPAGMVIPLENVKFLIAFLPMSIVRFLSSCASKRRG